ncbi:MAG: type I restriction endonuclease subunit R, partial [candidate division WOR-3 bacterium]
LPVYEIDENTLKRIAESSASELEKVFSLLASIADKVKKDGWENPILFSIGERAELISQLFQARQKNTQETLKELSELITEINAVESERKTMNLSPQAFSVFRILKENHIHSAEEIARLANNIFAQYPYWGKSSEQLRTVKQELYSLFLNKGITTEQSYDLINKIIQLIRRAQE